MECLICKNSIVINSFSMLFAMEEPKICQRCEEQMIPKKWTTFPIQLYEDNEFIRELIRRLELGDFVLLDVIIPTFHRVLRKFKSDIKVLIPYEMEDQKIEILVESLQFKGEGLNPITVTSILPEQREQDYFISIL